MPRKRRRRIERRSHDLTPGMEAWIRGEPIPEPETPYRDGPDREDWIGLEYFGSVRQGGRLIRAQELLDAHPELAKGRDERRREAREEG